MAAPVGNRNAAKAKVWSAAIHRALDRRVSERGVGIDDLADKLIDLCLDGDLSALKEFGDRIEGKPAQAVTVAGDPDNPVEMVHRRIIDANP
jgi:hypothetical protein